MKKAPKIRFDGYTEDWEQRKLGEVFEQTTNFLNPSEEEIELWSLTVEEGLTPKSERYNREFLVKKETNFKEVRPGDIVYNPMNMTLGAVGYNGMAKSVAVSGYYTTMIANKGYDSYYINTWLKSPQAISLYKTFATGSLKEKQRVQFPTLSIIPVAFPNYEEQVKIGKYFSNLDHLITLHQKECEKMLDFKEYMLSKMFPMGDADYPDVRLQGYSANWTRRKFADFSFPTGEKNKNNLPLEPYAITKEYGFIAQSEAHEEFGYMKDADRTLYIIVRPNSFAYNPARINIGSLGYYEGTENVIVSSLYEVFQTDNDVDDTFLQYWFKTNKFQRWIERLQEGSVRLYFYYDKLCECTLMMPCLQEQQAIGQYFRKLDELILFHQREVEAYKKMKQYMLRNMFV